MSIIEHLMTVDQFEAWLAQPEQDDRRFELIDGSIVENVTTEQHNLISGNLYVALRAYVQQHDAGRVVYETNVRVQDDDFNWRVPDLAFTVKARLLPITERGAIPQLPDLAVEIKSPSDTYAKLRRKAAYYLANGTRLVWLIYPEKRLVEVYQSDADSALLTDADMLDGGGVLPGFRVQVGDVFAEYR